MLPYFYKLKTRLISDELSTYLTSISLDNIDKFTAHITESGEYDGNNYLYSERLQNISEIKTLKEKCYLDFYCILYMHLPNTSVVIHKDNPKYRKSNIIHPLYPLENYSPTQFYEDSHNIISTCNFDDRLPVILNLNKLHSLKNNESYRINLQFSFAEDFETVVNLYKENKLFKD